MQYQTSLRMASSERKRSKYVTARHYSPMNKFDLEIVLKRADGYLETCQTSKIECFLKIVNDNYFRETLHLNCLAGF